MTLYEIDEKIVNGIQIDPETGEVLNAEEIDALQMERDVKIENIALWIKDLKAESDAMKGEIDVLSERKRVTDNKVKSLSSYLSGYLNGQKYESSKVQIRYRTSKAVEYDDELMGWLQTEGHDEFLRFRDPEINKTALKEAIQNGAEIPHAWIAEKTNMTVR